MNIKALVYTDLQATEGSEKLFSDPSVPLQRYRVDLFYNRLKEIYDENRCNALWDLGDTTDDRTAIPIPTLTSISTGLSYYDFSEWNIKLIGNHEQYLRSPEYDVGSIFRHVFHIPQKETVYAKIFGNVAVICASYDESPDFLSRLVNIINEHKFAKKKVLVLGHLLLTGTSMPSGVAKAGLPVNLFGGITAMLGHIHKPQELGSNIVYLGSPFQQNFGERDENKRLAIVEIDGKNFKIRYLPLDGFPRYYRVSYKTFVESINPESEDRYEVVLKNKEESDQFYVHPLAWRATPIYEYQSSIKQDSDKTEVSIDYTDVRTLAKKYATTHDPKSFGIDMSIDELVDVGVDIAETVC